MAFIKRHLMLLSCGLLAVLSLAAMAVGVVVGNVGDPMQKAEALSKKLGSVGRDCVNNEHIRQAEEKAQKIAGDRDKIKGIVKKMNARPPLRDKVFPVPERPSDAYGFRDAYRQALDGLLPNVLKAKAPPTQDEIARMRALIQKEQQDARKGQAAPGGTATPGAGGPGTGEASPTAAPTTGGKPSQPSGKPVGPTIEELAKTDADVRMSLVRAHEAFCYASPQAISVSANLLDNKDVPDPEQMWEAQMSLWIQTDVLAALAKVNDAAAANLKPEDRWVAHMPVKELVGIRISDYVLGPGAGEAAGAAAASSKWVEIGPEVTPPPGDASAVFTGRTSNELYDVIQFAVELVIDARELPAVIDGICGANFFTPLTITCSSPTVVPSFRGKVYGSDPVMRVRIEFEGCFFREFYHFYDGNDGKDGKPAKPFMPTTLAEQIVRGQRTGRDGRMSPSNPAPPRSNRPSRGGGAEG